MFLYGFPTSSLPSPFLFEARKLLVVVLLYVQEGGAKVVVL